jgi:hypothetical protein
MALHPELEQPRARVDRRVLALCGVSAVAITAASFASIAFLARTAPPPPEVRAVRVPIPLPVPTPIAAPAVAPAPPADEPPPRVAVKRGQGDDQTSWLPAAYHHALSDDEAEDLVQFVNTWVTSTDARPEPPPSVEYRRGVVFVESTEDRGDDGPYPRSAGPEAQRVCGTVSTWLLAALSERLHYRDDIECFGNICTYPGMEYAPRGYLVFRPIDRDRDLGRAWVLEAWVQSYELFGPDAEKEADFIPTALDRLATTRCPGEPAGYY